MPARPKTICRHPGCGRLIDAPGYCDKHEYPERERKARFDQTRKNSHERGYTYQWSQAREVFLKAYPLCTRCEQRGRLTPATVVDHIIPHRGDDDLFWDETNWQPLCASCHSRKTAKEDGGFGNRSSAMRSSNNPNHS